MLWSAHRSDSYVTVILSTVGFFPMVVLLFVSQYVQHTMRNSSCRPEFSPIWEHAVKFNLIFCRSLGNRLIAYCSNSLQNYPILWILGFYMPKLRSDYEACHSGGLRINSDHLGFFKVHPIHGHFLHSVPIRMWLQRTELNPWPWAQQCKAIATGLPCWATLFFTRGTKHSMWSLQICSRCIDRPPCFQWAD